MNILKGWTEYGKQLIWHSGYTEHISELEDGLVLVRNKFMLSKQSEPQFLISSKQASGDQVHTTCRRIRVFVLSLKRHRRPDKRAWHLQVAQTRLQLTDFPMQPWEVLDSDILEYKADKYLITVDYYSRFPITGLLSILAIYFTNITEYYHI